MAAQQTRQAAVPRGIQYVTDESGHRTAVILSLEEWGEVWEDFLDVLIAESRASEPRVPWEHVRASLDAGDDLPR